jgi:hypothetical protein
VNRRFASAFDIPSGFCYRYRQQSNAPLSCRNSSDLSVLFGAAIAYGNAPDGFSRSGAILSVNIDALGSPPEIKPMANA